VTAYKFNYFAQKAVQVPFSDCIAHHASDVVFSWKHKGENPVKIYVWLTPLSFQAAALQHITIKLTPRDCPDPHFSSLGGGRFLAVK
jgi:hypothetical protein